jgi:hypothetical protein
VVRNRLRDGRVAAKTILDNEEVGNMVMTWIDVIRNDLEEHQDTADHARKSRIVLAKSRNAALTHQGQAKNNVTRESDLPREFEAWKY